MVCEWDGEGRCLLGRSSEGGSILVYINLVYLVQWTEKHEMGWDA